MKRKSVGKVFAKTRSREFSFVATEYFEGDFVEVDIPDRGDAVVVAEIIGKEGVNPYLDNPEVMNYVSKDEQELTSFNLYVFTATPISLVDKKSIKPVKFPLPPGANVYVATKDNVKRALEIREGDVKIGNLDKSPNPEIRITTDNLFQPHISVLGRTGSGKSYFVRGLSCHIKDRNLIIFSPTDEYNEIGEEHEIKILSKQDILLPLKADFIGSIYNLTLQEEILLKKGMARISLKEKISSGQIANRLKNWVVQSAIASIKKKPRQVEFLKLEKTESQELEEVKTPNYVNTALHKLRSKSLYFSNNPMEVPFENSVILDMSEIEQEAQEIIINYVLHNLLEAYRSRKGGSNRPKLLVIIEEAHNYAPSVRTTFCKDKIIQVAREGRKLGINLCLISQRPRHFDQTVLSQCSTLFLFHIPHPDDVNHVFSVSSFYSQHLVELVQRLEVGRCLITGTIFKYPIVCLVDFS